MAKRAKAAKKKAAKKKAAKKKATRKASRKKPAGRATRAATIRNVAMFAGSLDKTVTFANSNPDVLVRIDVGSAHIAAGVRSASFAPGDYDLFYASQGSGDYTVTVTGATLSRPMAGTAPDDGVLVMTVAP